MSKANVGSKNLQEKPKRDSQKMESRVKKSPEKSKFDKPEATSQKVESSDKRSQEKSTVDKPEPTSQKVRSGGKRTIDGRRDQCSPKSPWCTECFKGRNGRQEERERVGCWQAMKNLFKRKSASRVGSDSSGYSRSRSSDDMYDRRRRSRRRDRRRSRRSAERREQRRRRSRRRSSCESDSSVSSTQQREAAEKVTPKDSKETVSGKPSPDKKPSKESEEVLDVKDITKTCCYLCAKNTLAISAAISRKVRAVDKPVQVGLHKREKIERKKRSKDKVKTADVGTVCPDWKERSKETKPKPKAKLKRDKKSKSKEKSKARSKKKRNIFQKLTYTRCPATLQKTVGCVTEETSNRADPVVVKCCRDKE